MDFNQSAVERNSRLTAGSKRVCLRGTGGRQWHGCGNVRIPRFGHNRIIRPAIECETHWLRKRPPLTRNNGRIACECFTWAQSSQSSSSFMAVIIVITISIAVHFELRKLCIRNETVRNWSGRKLSITRIDEIRIAFTWTHTHTWPGSPLHNNCNTGDSIEPYCCQSLRDLDHQLRSDHERN